MQDGGLTPSFSEVVDALQHVDRRVAAKGETEKWHADAERLFLEQLAFLARRRYAENAAAMDAMKRSGQNVGWLLNDRMVAPPERQN